MDEDATDADVKAAQPSVLVKLAAAVQAMTGLFVGLTGLQITGLRFYEYPFLSALPYVLMLSGAALLGVASFVYRARTWAAIAACVLAPSLTLILGGWMLYSFGAVFSCLLLMAVPGAALSSLLAFVSLGSVRTAAAARRRLAEQGMNLGM